MHGYRCTATACQPCVQMKDAALSAILVVYHAIASDGLACVPTTEKALSATLEESLATAAVSQQCSKVNTELSAQWIWCHSQFGGHPRVEMSDEALSGILHGYRITSAATGHRSS
ncbi:hypothetical protein DPMN_156280 [Dreissena polymorpha]|uniref:Uncharacterized protein n=1 Tax=Dreissena polymorpha TaxID=45954 RepID=A0A9D4FQF6_DREPO|nr:hypothetical protein DPMN_156280 [Dreissena polymorpha]